MSRFAVCAVLVFSASWAFGHGDSEHAAFSWEDVLSSEPGRRALVEDDLELELEGGSPLSPDFRSLACRVASTSQKAEVERGNRRKAEFLQACATTTANSPWCAQLVRPNPSSLASFRCTYGEGQAHQLIHPDEETWKYAFQAVRLIEDIEARGIRVCQIYNWWRPEPYNANVGGAAGRHPYGTSVDVRFCTKGDQEAAHRLLCQYRRAGRLRALGYYSSTSLHFGVGDNVANTWGKACP